MDHLGLHAQLVARPTGRGDLGSSAREPEIPPAGSSKRLAAAVGEGSAWVQLVHRVVQG